MYVHVVVFWLFFAVLLGAFGRRRCWSGVGAPSRTPGSVRPSFAASSTSGSCGTPSRSPPSTERGPGHPDTGKQGQHNINKTLPLLARSWCAQTKIVELLYCTTLVHSSARVCSRFLASGVPVAVCLFGRLNGCLRYDESSSNVRLSGAIRGGLSTVCLDGFKCPQGSSCRSVRLFFGGKAQKLTSGGTLLITESTCKLPLTILIVCRRFQKFCWHLGAPRRFRERDSAQKAAPSGC